MPRTRSKAATDLQAEKEEVIYARRSPRICAKRGAADSDHKSQLSESSSFIRSTRSSRTSSVEEEPVSNSAKKPRGRKPLAIKKQATLKATTDKTKEYFKKSTLRSKDVVTPKKHVKQNLFKKIQSNGLYVIAELAEIEDLLSNEAKATLSQDKLENRNSAPTAEKTDSALKDNEVTDNSQNTNLKEPNTPKKPEENSAATKDVDVVVEETKEKSTNSQKDSQDMNIKEPNSSKKSEHKNVTIIKVRLYSRETKRHQQQRNINLKMAVLLLFV